MFIFHSREKLLNAIAFFVQNTKYCGTLKLFKLLNFLDFEHYRQTGRSVTDLRYLAWKQGPVPADLWREIQAPPADLSKIAEIVEHRDGATDELNRREFRIKARFDSRYFTKRELAIMERLAFFFKELRAEEMSRYSHSKRMPWAKVYREGDNSRAIPYELSLESDAILKDMPTIDREELDYRREALQEIDNQSK